MDIAILFSTVVVISIISLSAIVFFLTKTYNNYLLSTSHKKEMEEVLSSTKTEVYTELEEAKQALDEKLKVLQSQINKIEVKDRW